MSQAKQSPSKMLVMLPIFFMAQKVTYTDDLVNILRISYYAVQAVTLLVAYVYIRNKIMAANDRTPIYLPPVALPFGMGPAADNPRPKETSYFDHEMEQLNTLIRSTLIGVAMVSFMHWKMGVKPVLLLQTLMGPMNLMDNGLVKKYVLGSKERVWGELLDGEDDATIPVGAVGAVEKEGEGESVEEKAKRMEKVMDEVFNKEKPCAALLKVLQKENVNYQTQQEQYSPLTVLCSRPDVTEEQVKQALFLGAHKFHRDEDGCTALHWAAMKGAVAAATVLTSGNNRDVEKLLGMQDGDKKTAVELAKESIEPTHEQVEAILQAAEKRIEAAMVENLD
ncbi:Ankyrin repeat-containing domain protein [Nannochloropsis gaditana]|uniref:Ankyrin repeat-containing domain protein n=1 Tax=Nannochloropsis gaditana TaxID=72520 RepID=W7TIV3_9STRA|nr:Ankyrin repeat-containing domain protein [Nannochloropsis gaditana]